MFTNIGGKLKMVAQVFAWIGIGASLLGGAVMIFSGGFLAGLLVAALGALLSWISALAMYGFGELVENSDIRTNLAIKADQERAAKQQ